MLLRPHNALQLYFRIKKIPDGCSRTVRDAKTRAIAGGYAERALEEDVELATSGGLLYPEFFEQLQQLVSIRVAKIADLVLGDRRHPGLCLPYALCDLCLSRAKRLKFRDDVLPVHAVQYKQTFDEAQQKKL